MTADRILVINSGSSSIKYQVIEPETGTRIAKGLVERIGEHGAAAGIAVGHLEHRAGTVFVERQLPIRTHTEGFEAMVAAFAEAGTPIEDLGIVAVGHRVVHGGQDFIEPTLIDDRVAERILELAELAPLHNPGHHAAIIAARQVFPDLPHVAVFDTAFHRTMPPAAYTYAIDTVTAAQHGVRRYGFHGISFEVVSRRAAAHLGRPETELRQIILHLGNGASMCAVDGGRSIDTTMGLTPLEGLVMGTRSGDIDPGAMLHLLRRGLSVDDLDQLLNHRSGWFGMAGSNDLRDVRQSAAAGDPDAALALDVYVHRARAYLGAYLALLGGADAIVFTAGVGEHGADIRERICADLEWCGVRIDPALNAADSDDARIISTPDSRVSVLVVPTDEEAEIARQTRELVRAA